MRALAQRRTFRPRYWILDSGAFTELSLYGCYRNGVEVYASEIRRWSGTGRLLAAVTQDYMCEPHMLARTGLTVMQHQDLTIARYDALRACDIGGVYVMPVLQGYQPREYAAHVRAYGSRLRARMWVGVGSVCKRNKDPATILAVLRAIRAERPDLRLHGFGLKLTALKNDAIREDLHTGDSMSWSYHARCQGRDANDHREAIRFVEKVEALSR